MTVVVRTLLLLVAGLAATAGLLWLRTDSTPPPQCSGVSVDPGDDIQEALDEGGEGVTLCLEAGTYRVEETLDLDDGVSLIGVGMDATFLESDGANIVLDAEGSSDITLAHMDVSGAHGSRACRPQCGAGLAGGTDVTVDSMSFHDNENHGIGGSEGLTVTNSVFHHNGSNGFTGCCAGGIKSGHGFVVRNSEVYANIGNGLWCDSGCPAGMEVTDTVIRDNTLDGIRYEVSSGGAVIRDNVIENNNTTDSLGGHGGITVVASDNAEITGNKLGGNGHGGIVVAHTPRGTASNVKVAGNSLNGDEILGCEQEVDCSDNG